MTISAKLTAAGCATAAVPIMLVAAIGSALTGVAGGTSTCAPTDPPPAEVPGYDPEQTTNAAAIVAVGKQLDIPERGWIVAVTAAMQESGLHNLDHGDRDSLGLFQQRPSQGWGTPDQILDPTYAATQFYRHLHTVPNWEHMAVNDAAQAVQRSGTPTAYTKHEQAARQLVNVLNGAACATPAAGRIRTTWPPEHATEPDPTSNGHITPRTLALVRALQASGLTGKGLGCYGPRPANPNSDHPQGHACDAMFNPNNQQSVAEGWRTANWLIAHQATLGVRYLIWQGQYWSADNPTWVPYTSHAYGCPNPTNLTGCHYDHIHISMF